MYQLQLKNIFIIVFIIYGLLITSCSKKTEETTTEQHPQNRLRIALSGEIPSLDPQLREDIVSTRVMYDLFAGLLDFDQQNRPIAGMAESWQISPDKKIYTFKLRKNLKFSDGSPITANDFVYSWQRLVDPKTGSTYNWLLDNVVNGKNIIENKMDKTKLGVTALNNLTFVVTLLNPDSAFLSKCTLPNLFVVSKNVIQKYGNEWTKPQNIVTSGAYILKEHVVNGYMNAIKNPFYYDAHNVKINEVVYFPYENINASIAAYTSGQIDLTFVSVPIDQYQSIKQKYKSQLNSVPQDSVYYYNLNMLQPEFKNNLKLRMALSMAVDRNILTKEVLNTGQIPIYSVVSPTIEHGKYKDVKYGWSSWSRKKQILTAQKLYKEAGYNKNKPFQSVILYNNSEVNKKIAISLVSMWQEVLGAKITLQNQEWKTFLIDRRKGNYQISRDAWLADYDNVTFYTPLYQCGNIQNRSHYCNPQFNQLIDKALVTLDDKQQQQLYTEAFNIALNDYSTIPLFENTYQRLVKPYVKGLNLSKNYLDHSQSKWIYFK